MRSHTVIRPHTFVCDGRGPAASTPDDRPADVIDAACDSEVGKISARRLPRRADVDLSPEPSHINHVDELLAALDAELGEHAIEVSVDRPH